MKAGEHRMPVTDVFELQLAGKSPIWADVRKMVLDRLRSNTTVPVGESSKLKLYAVERKELEAAVLDVSSLTNKLIGADLVEPVVKHVAAVLSEGHKGLRTCSGKL